MTIKSNAIGDASFIGLECESGNFSDCDLDDSDEPVSFGCGSILIFSNSSRTCGSFCGLNRAKRSADENGIETKKEGWTRFYMSSDDPTGTGDHEHYWYYVKTDDELKVYDLDGQAWRKCTKKAIVVRDREYQKFWWELSRSYTFLFSNGTKYYENGAEQKIDYQKSLKPDYG